MHLQWQGVKIPSPNHLLRLSKAARHLWGGGMAPTMTPILAQPLKSAMSQTKIGLFWPQIHYFQTKIFDFWGLKSTIFQTKIYRSFWGPISATVLCLHTRAPVHRRIGGRACFFQALRLSDYLLKRGNPQTIISSGPWAWKGVVPPSPH